MIDAVKGFVTMNGDQLGVLGGCMAFIGLIWYLYRPDDWEWLQSSPKRRGKMLKRERRKYVDHVVTDAFVSSIEDMVASNALTRQEASETYRRMKQLFPIRDLFPSTEALKENIRRRLTVLKQEGAMPLPDRKVKKKHMFSK